ncbi:MAG: RHS repeat-associated core domain-containing protein [Paracoccaceae bacterium]
MRLIFRIIAIAFCSLAAVSASAQNLCNQIYSIAINSQRALEAKSVDEACSNGLRLISPAWRRERLLRIEETPGFDPNGVQNQLSFECVYYRESFAGDPSIASFPGNAYCDFGSGWQNSLCEIKADDCGCPTCGRGGLGGEGANYGPLVGNPITVGGGEKFQNVVDWASPKEPRFKFLRHYSTANNGIPDYSNTGYGHSWSSPWAKQIVRVSPTRLVTFFPGSRRRAFEENGGAMLPLRSGHPFSLSEAGNADATSHVLTDGTGLREFYSEDSSAYSYLEKVVWPDGYEITFQRDVNNRLTVMEDNRDQRAEFTWDTTLNPNVTIPVISLIKIDTDYDGNNFFADVEIAYTNVFDDFWANRLTLMDVEVTDVAASSVIEKQTYSYSSDYDVRGTPHLVGIADGRLDDNGQTFDYSTFTYGIEDDATKMRALSTAHSNGADEFSLQGSSPTAGISTYNPLTKQTNYDFSWIEGRLRPTSITGLQTPDTLPTTRTFDYTTPSGGTDGYVYEQIERNGSKTTFDRDSRGLVLTKTEDTDGASPRITTYTWDANLRLPIARTTTQMEETFSYDADGLLISYTQTDVLIGSPSVNASRTWTYTYSVLASGLKVLTSLDGPGLLANGVNDVSTNSYNTDGTMASSTDPNGLITNYAAYDKFGNLTRLVQPDGVAWTMDYDAEGQLIEVIENADQNATNKTTFTYDVVGQMTSYTTASGEHWTLTYDPARRLTSIENSTGERMNFTHDAASNVTSTEYVRVDGTTAFSQTTAYDELSRIRETLGAQGQQTTFSYDEEDNLTTVIDGAQFATTNSYDALSRLIQVIDRTSGLTEMDYDDADQMTEFTDPRQIDTGMTYNGFGELVQEVSADRGTMTYTYDSRGLVASMVDGNGVLSTYSYDNGGRITARKFPSDPSQNQKFTYDYTTNSQGEGKINRTDDASGFWNRRYDNGGYISRELRRIENKTYTTNYNVGSRARLESVKTPGKLELSYFYDSQDRVTKITAQRVVKDPVTNQFPPPVDVIKFVKYNPFGPVAQFRFGDNGLLNRRAFDQSYRLKAKRDWTGSAPLRNVTYGWTARDNLSFVSDSLDPLKSETYQYTPREFLAEAVGEYGEIDYTYDAVGNRATRALYQNASTVTDFYAYPLTSNQLDSISLGAGGTRGFTYDAAGNVIYDNRNGQGYGYTYDAANRMESFSINGVVQEEYLYNAMGQQVVRRMTQAGKTIHVIHDLDGNRLAEYEIDNATGTRTLLQEYIWFNGVPVAIVDGQTDEIFFVRTDHIGRPVFAADANGVKVWEASYLPFGGVNVASSAAIKLRFPGQWFHMESGLHQNWMRDYDPTTGRYIQADPLGLVDGASVYGYVRQNPGRYTDPTGEYIPALLAGIALGAGLDLLSQLWANDGNLACVNWARVGAAGAVGAIGGPYLSGLTRGLGGKRLLGDASARAAYRKKYGLSSDRVVHHGLKYAERGVHGNGAGLWRHHFMNFRNVASKHHNPIHGKNNNIDGIGPFNPAKAFAYGAPTWTFPTAGLPIAGGLAELFAPDGQCACEN